MLTLRSDALLVELDPGHGADVLSIIDRHSGIDVMFATPWRQRADRIRSGEAQAAIVDATGRWMEQYRGGWQTLCPNAGMPREHAGAPFEYHGEASMLAWSVGEHDERQVQLTAELLTSPVTIERTVTVASDAIRIDDLIRNRSPLRIELDYVSHPAFGGRFLDSECTIDTGARVFVRDSGGSAEHESRHQWPWYSAGETVLDLRRVPPPSEQHSMFGWLQEFDSGWASVTSTAHDLTVTISWDATVLPYAWLWEELNGSPGFPWFHVARALAIEPSSTPTSGPGRQDSLVLQPHGTKRIGIELAVRSGSSG